MIYAEVVARWTARRNELQKLGATVDGAKICDEFLADLAALATSEGFVTLTEAARHTGYTADSLSRMIREGRLTNHGRKHAPRVRVSECPKKPARPEGLAGRYANAYHPDTDARSLVGSRR